MSYPKTPPQCGEYSGLTIEIGPPPVPGDGQILSYSVLWCVRQCRTKLLEKAGDPENPKIDCPQLV